MIKESEHVSRYVFLEWGITVGEIQHGRSKTNHHSFADHFKLPSRQCPQ